MAANKHLATGSRRSKAWKLHSLDGASGARLIHFVQALTWDGENVAVTERPVPQLDAGQVLVAMTLAGICSTDLEIVRGYMGFRGTLGHELLGRVERGPSGLVGKRVVAEINFACGVCSWCERALQRHCPTRRVLGILEQDGAFAEKVAIPQANLHIVPDDLSDEEAVFAEPLAAAFEILEQVSVRPGDEALVLGDGKLGLLVAQVLALAGARVLAVGHHEEHLALLRECGIATVLEKEWDGGRRAIVVEATGTSAGFKKAVKATRARGTLVLKSTVADHAAVDLAPLVIDEITVVGSRCGPFEPALRALSEGLVVVRPMITAERHLQEGAEALALARQAGALKVLLRNPD